MKAKRLLQIAAGLMAFHLVGHSFGHGTWRQATDPAQQAVIRQMTENRFPFMGAVRSMGDYYEGYGWACSIAFIFFALTLWFIANSLPGNGTLIRKILVALTICLFAWCIDEFLFFFPFAASTTLLAAVAVVFALVQLKSRTREG